MSDHMNRPDGPRADSPKPDSIRPDSADRPEQERARAIPRGRVSRLSQFGRLAGGVAGGMLAEGARKLAKGERPRMRDMMLTPGNVGKVADRLSNLRGAAMKMGQMISLDSGDILPAELSEILARLRDNAHHMPPSQLKKVLDEQWGVHWRRRFKSFDARPIAAASIGQVHRAVTPDGRELAIKVQYPGVRESINADVDNVSTLLRVSGLMPTELDMKPLLAEAKRQLADEADYLREAEQLKRFGKLLADDDRFIVPVLEPEFTTDCVLAMSFEQGQPIESLETASQQVRDTSMNTLVELVLRELFIFGVMQTDPNFANYRYQTETGRLVVLDFGAVRDVEPDTISGYRNLLVAGLASDRDAMREAAMAAGFFGPNVVTKYRDKIDRMMDIIIAENSKPGPFDFGDRGFVGDIRDDAAAIAADRTTWHLPPTDLLFVQRKISGSALLAARLKARVDVQALTHNILAEAAAQQAG